MENKEPTKNGNGGDKGTKPDILDEVRAIEIATKKMLLIKTLAQIKEMAKQRLELAEKCIALLSEIGISDEDTKRIIDFVNNLGTVQLNENEKKSIREWAKKEISGERKKVEEKVEDKIKFFADGGSMFGLVGAFPNNKAGVSTGSPWDPTGGVHTTCDDRNVILCSLADGTSGKKDTLEISM